MARYRTVLVYLDVPTSVSLVFLGVQIGVGGMIPLEIPIKVDSNTFVHDPNLISKCSTSC
jgi:hypothetical protein